MLKKKEKLEQMRELGRGGLSKGLSFLRTAAASAAIEGGDASASASAPSGEEGGGATRLSYEELVALSMKLTRQNKLMKAQFQKMQTRLAAAATSDADCTLLRSFVEQDVGLDLAACERSTASATDEDKTAGSLDGDELRERYRILVALREKERSPGVESVDLLALSPVASTVGNKSAPGYEEIDLLGGETGKASAVEVEKQLDEAVKQVERMREQLRQGAEQTNALERRLAERDAQQQEARAALEADKRLLEERLAQLQETQAETERVWQAKWDEQSALLASLQKDGEQETKPASEDKTQEMQVLEKQKDELEKQLQVLQEQVDAGVKQHEAAQRETASALEKLQQEKMKLVERLSEAEEKARSEADAGSSRVQERQLKAEEEAKALAEKLETQRVELESVKSTNVHLQDELSAARASDLVSSDQLDEKRTEDSSTALKVLEDEVERLKTSLQARESENESLQQAVVALEARQKAEVEQQPAKPEQDGATEALMQELERVKLEAAEHVHEMRTLQDKLRVAEERVAKAHKEHEVSESLVEALKEDTSRLADQVALLEQQQGAAQQEHETLSQAKRELEQQRDSATEARVALEKQLEEERAYWTTKLETLITEGDAANTKAKALESELADKDKQVSRMASSQKSMTAEMMELQKQLGTMREDLAMAAEGLEAHATKAEASEQRCTQLEREATELKTQLAKQHAQQQSSMEALQSEKERELQRVKSELKTATTEKKELIRERDELKQRRDALARELEAAKKQEQELEAALSEQTNQVGNLSVDLAETKKALSDRMALATRLQTENMGMASKQAEQVALIESALRDATVAKKAQQEMETQVQAAKTQVQRVQQDETKARQALEDAQREMQEQADAFQVERQEAHRKLEEAVQAEKARFDREVERVEAESKHKSKLALQAVLEKESEIARLSARLREVEEDVRSGGADNRKILELAQLQAKREAEARAQATAMQELTEQLEDARREVQELREDKRRHAEELTAMLQTQRRDGVNMEYLKNVVVQYMSFRPGSSQQARLVPVLATLLQFAPADMQEIKRAASSRRGSSWTSWGAGDSSEDYKPIVVGAGHRHPVAPPVSSSSTNQQHDGAAAGRKSLSNGSQSAGSEVPSPMITRPSSFILPNGSHDEGAHPSAESADF